MVKHRRSNVPPLPQSLDDLQNTIREFPPVSEIYQGSCTGEDGSVALIFIHPEMKERLRSTQALWGDGTFKVSNNLSSSDPVSNNN